MTDETTQNLDSQIADLLNRIHFAEEDKRHFLEKLPSLSAEDKRHFLDSLEEVEQWKKQIEIDEKILQFQEDYPKLIEKAKNEIMAIVNKERTGQDQQKAAEILGKLKEMRSNSEPSGKNEE